MENLKIKVANEAESKEAQELFFALGGDFYFGGKVYCNTHLSFITMNKDGLMANIELDGFDYKSITLPQLRDMVVLKRNSLNDATHGCMGDKFLVQENLRYEWTYSGWATSGIAMSKLKPIQEKQVATNNIEQQIAAHDILAQCEPKLFLDPTQNYAEIEWDGTFLKGDDWIEVPNGVCWAYKNTRGKLIFMDGDIGESFKRDLVWQRTQDEPFLTPESVVASTHGLARDWVNKSASGSIHGTINPKPDFIEQGAIVSDGGSTDYYKKEIPALVLERWKKTGIIEAEDVIRLFLGNDFTQGNNFKAGVRLISAQQGKGKAGIDQMYDLNKQEWFVASAKKAFIEFD